MLKILIYVNSRHSHRNKFQFMSLSQTHQKYISEPHKKENEKNKSKVNSD